MQAGTLQHLSEGAKAQCDAKDGKRFGEWGGGVGGGERAEGGEQQGDPGGTRTTDIACQACDEQAGNEVDQRLQVQDSLIIGHAEESKTEGKKCRVAGQAHQGGLDGGYAGWVAHGMAVDTVGEPVGGNVPIDQGVTLDLRVGVDKPQA